MFISIFSRIGIIFIIFLIGTLARWRKVLTEESTNALCRLAIEITLPFLYFYTLSTGLEPELFSSILVLPLLAMLLILTAYFLSWLACWRLKLTPDERRSFRFLVSFPNYGFLAFPIIFALFGQEGLVMAFLFNLGITFLYWTLGVTILSGANTKGRVIFKNLANNAILGLLLGLFVGVNSFKIPQFILDTSKMIGDATIPLALIVVGSILAKKSPRRIGSLRPILTLIFYRLILIPSLALLFINIFDGLPKMLAVIIVIQAAMPSASTTPILTKRFGGDTEFAASGVFFTTLISIITVPFFITLALR
jgi:predicted permease